MIYGFARQSRGHVKIYSEVGIGTTVRLYLPRAATGAEALRAPAQDETAEEWLSRGETILLVEDDTAVRKLAMSQLAGLGYTMIEAADGAAARLVLASDRALDLLFTDVVMPGGISGRALADEAMRMRPTIKTLFTSGYTENSIVHRGQLDPDVHFLPKPYRRQELARKVREALDGKA
jgi:CheY-like chemotaxis protein